MARTNNPNVERANLEEMVGWLSANLGIEPEEFDSLLGVDSFPQRFEDAVYTSHVIQVKGLRTFINWGTCDQPQIRQAVATWFSHGFVHHGRGAEEEGKETSPAPIPD